jgi:hypothetical protein
MFAYTAWDSLQTIARQFDANLTLSSEERIGMSPRRVCSAVTAPVRGLAERVRTGLFALYTG